jgi:transposase
MNIKIFCQHVLNIFKCHIQNGKSYEQVAQYFLQSLSAVKQWVRHYKDEGIDRVIVLTT